MPIHTNNFIFTHKCFHKQYHAQSVDDVDGDITDQIVTENNVFTPLIIPQLQEEIQIKKKK